MAELGYPYPAFPLPGWVYLPGRTAAADQAPLDAVKALVPGAFDGFVPASHPAFLYGMALHDAGFFWEAHEVLEAVWMAAPQNGLDRLALRALIQITNASLKRDLGQPNAVRRLMAEADGLIYEISRRGGAPGGSVAAFVMARPSPAMTGR